MGYTSQELCIPGHVALRGTVFSPMGIHGTGGGDYQTRVGNSQSSMCVRLLRSVRFGVPSLHLNFRLTEPC